MERPGVQFPRDFHIGRKFRDRPTADQGTASTDIEPNVENELDDETHEIRTDGPGTLNFGAHIHPGSATTTSSMNTRYSTCKHKEREDLGDLSAALAACICGNSAVPTDSADYPNLACCKTESSETKWYHLACLELGKFSENWVCEACLSAGSSRGTKRRWVAR
ncbi:hypothetical protein DFH09DRAFT_1096036 [Mycena vulgaris]|nr:hypothetical protein DFH09DRAFT_1096036 [Mycena vulgaris]